MLYSITIERVKTEYVAFFLGVESRGPDLAHILETLERKLYERRSVLTKAGVSSLNASAVQALTELNEFLQPMSPDR